MMIVLICRRHLCLLPLQLFCKRSGQSDFACVQNEVHCNYTLMSTARAVYRESLSRIAYICACVQIRCFQRVQFAT